MSASSWFYYMNSSKLYMPAVQNKQTQKFINWYSKTNWPDIKLSSANLYTTKLHTLCEERTATSGPRQ